MIETMPRVIEDKFLSWNIPDEDWPAEEWTSTPARTPCSPLIKIRDQQCRTPWCGAPIRQADHIQAHADGGPTSLHNGQGLCEACNYIKQASGWRSTPHHDPHRGHTVTITTPTGHTYRSTQPTGPGDAGSA